MTDWLAFETAPSLDPGIATLSLRLVIAWIAGCGIAFIARRGKPSADRETLTLTLILMSILIAMATQIIGDNIARAFSLVGALSIVRFRTAVPATRDVAFVLAAVVVGMAVGAGQYWVAGLGLAIVALATRFGIREGSLRKKKEVVSPPGGQVWQLALQVGLHAIGGWEDALTRSCQQHELVSAGTARRGSTLEMVYRCVLHPETDASRLIAELNALPNVESVSVKQA